MYPQYRRRPALLGAVRYLPTRSSRLYCMRSPATMITWRIVLLGRGCSARGCCCGLGGWTTATWFGTRSKSVTACDSARRSASASAKRSARFTSAMLTLWRMDADNNGGDVGGIIGGRADKNGGAQSVVWSTWPHTEIQVPLSKSLCAWYAVSGTDATQGCYARATRFPVLTQRMGVLPGPCHAVSAGTPRNRMQDTTFPSSFVPNFRRRVVDFVVQARLLSCAMPGPNGAQ